MSLVPRFVRRRVLLARARELLAAGDPRGALAVLSDPLCAGSEAAADLVRAAELHLASLPKDGPSAAIRDLLATMRAERQARAAAAGRTESAPPEPVLDLPRVERLARLRLAIDDAGEYLAVAGSDFLLGHASARRVDLPFLADVGVEHARLVLESDFRAGMRWRLVPLGSAHIAVAGRPVGVSGVDLHDGERIELAPNLIARFHAADTASASAVLDLGHGAECLGAHRVLLVVPGPEGLVRIGPTLARLVRVASLEHDVELEIATGSTPEVVVRCAGGVARGTRPVEESPREARLALPLGAAARVTLGARSRDRAPFEVVVSPDPDEGDMP